MMVQLILTVTRVAGWPSHLVGVCLLLSAGTLFGISWTAGLPHYSPNMAYVWERVEGDRVKGVTVRGGGLLEVAWGRRRAKRVPAPLEQAAEYVRIGRYGLRNPGFLEIGTQASAAKAPSGKPLLELTQVAIRWQFLTVVGMVATATPFLVGPSRRSILSAYRWLGSTLLAFVRSLWNLVSGQRSRPRGFEVVTPQPRHQA